MQLEFNISDLYLPMAFMMDNIVVLVEAKKLSSGLVVWTDTSQK